MEAYLVLVHIAWRVIKVLEDDLDSNIYQRNKNEIYLLTPNI